MKVSARRRPVLVTAVQYTDDMRVKDELPEGVVMAYWTGLDDDVPVLCTDDEYVPVVDGDWIVTDEYERSICKPDKFDEMYHTLKELD
jgi:hypothetical protein